MGTPAAQSSNAKLPKHKTVAPRANIGLFFTTLDHGGTEQQAILLAQGIDRTRFELVAYALRDGPLQAQLEALHIPIHILSTKKLGLTAAQMLRNRLKEDRIDILQCLLWHPNMIGRLACRGTGVLCINSVRWAERRIRDVADYATRSLVHHWIANSSHGAQLAKLAPTRTTIIPNALSDTLLHTPLTAWNPRPRSLIMVGRFRREKRWDVILAAAKLLPEWHFTLVGDGPLKGSYMKKARKQNLRNVEFAGQLSHSAMLKTLLQSSVSVLLSRSEGMPNVALEALALGVPFIGSDIAAHRELLADGRGTLVHDTPEALVGALQVLSSTPPKILEKRRMQTQQYIRARYSLKALTEQTQAVWSTLLQKRPA